MEIDPRTTVRMGLPVPASLSRAVVGGILGALLFVALVLWWRWLSGAMVRPLGFSATAAFSGLVLAILIATRLLAGDLADRRLAIGLSVAVAAIGLVLALAGVSAAGQGVFWCCFAIEETWAWRTAMRPTRRSMPPSPASLSREQIRIDPPQTVRSHLLVPSRDNERPEENVVQQLTRSRSADGGEILAGWVRVDLADGQRSTSVHLAFCPPLDRSPRLDVEQIDGPEAKVRNLQVLPYGARFDLKLVEPSEAASVLLLRFAARSDPTPSL